MALAFLNDCGFLPVAYSASDDFEVDAAADGFFLPAAAANPAVVDQATYFYFAYSADRSQREHGYAPWDDATSTLLRATGTVLNSTNAGALVNFSTQPTVVMGTTLANDWPFSTTALDGAVDGNNISVFSGEGATGNGGNIRIQTGGGDVNGGAMSLETGEGATGNGGSIQISGGDGDVDGGPFNAAGGGGSTGSGGPLAFSGGSGDLAGGAVTFNGGGGTSGFGGAIAFNGGTGNGGVGGSVTVQPGTGSTDGGDLIITLPAAGSGRQGLIIITGLPTADPSVSGALWSDGGVLTVS